MLKRFGFIFLLIFFLTIRLLPIAGNRFPFSYDNAKDTLAMRTMWETKRPTFLGPVTSLEGLYQGPLWYYLALPLNVILDFHPFASVATVLVLASISLYLLYRYFGFTEALLLSVATGVITTNQTAWAPYLIQFPVLFLICWLWKMIDRSKQNRKVTTLATVLLASCLGAMFHFEIAFAIVFLPLFALIFFLARIQIKKKQFLIGVMIFGLFFLPHFLFEIKHQFLQTKGVIYFVTHFSSQQAKVTNNLTFPQRLIELTTSMAGNIPESVAPLSLPYLTLVLDICLLLGCIVVSKRSKKLKEHLKVMVVPLVLGTLFFYLFLPFKPYYLVSLMPLWILLIGNLLHRLTIGRQVSIVSILILAAIFNMNQSTNSYQQLNQNHYLLVSAQFSAINAAYKLAAGRPFSSYQYVPEVYDFTYQADYLYLAQSEKLILPTEFGYQPGKTAYNPWNNRTEHAETLQTLIVEKDERPQFFANWWDTMTKDRSVISQIQVNNAITVYLTAPKTK